MNLVNCSLIRELMPFLSCELGFLTLVQAEKKKRKMEMQEAKRKKNIKKVERKMAAVARERAWAQRLAELQQLEEEKKKAAAMSWHILLF